MKQPDSWLESFSGVVRLFPLPNLVMFPQVMQPLHIFEPRYRQMTKHALDDDRLIALTLLKSNGEHMISNRPPIHRHLCVCRIMAEQETDDGRYNILIRGIHRGVIASELDCDTLYRQAEINLLDDVVPSDEAEATAQSKRLLQEIPAWFPNQPQVLTQLTKLLETDISLGTYCDIISFALPLPIEFKQRLLSELVVEQRAQLLLNRLMAKKSRRFPPEFSDN